MAAGKPDRTSDLDVDPERETQPHAEILDVPQGTQAWTGSVGRRSSRGILVATGLVAVLGIVAVLAVNQLTGPPRASSPGRSPAVVPGGLPEGLPGFVAGLPVITVDAALTSAGDSPSAPPELAVGGWYTAQRVAQVCQPSQLPQGDCVSDWATYLEAAPDPAWDADGNPLPGSGPHWFSPVFLDPVQTPALTPVVSSGRFEVIPPTPVVLIGHFNDDRLQAAGVFVVDGVGDPTGGLVAASTGVPSSTQLTSASVVELARAKLMPGAVVLELGALPWAANPFANAVGASAVEPSADGPPADGRTVWLVRGYLPGAGGPALASWLAIDDATGQVWGPLAAPAAAAVLPPHVPNTVDGLPVQTIAAALPTAAGRSPLLAVGGYLSNDRAPEGCPPIPTVGKPDPCTGTALVLVDRPIGVLQPDDATFLYVIAVPPGAASIRPVILPGTSVVDPWAKAVDGGDPLAQPRDASDRVSPRPVVLVGQFGDPRSPECAPRPGGGSAGCDRSFVVDQIAWIDGVSEDPSLYLDPGRTPTHDVKEVMDAVGGWFLPGAQPAVVSITSTTATDSASLTGVSLDGRTSDLFWVVRVVSSLTGGPASSSLVFDDHDLALVAVSP